MAISTEESKKPQSKKAKITALYAKHKPLLDALGVVNPKFIPKMAYVPHGGSELVIALFPSEISGGEDIYTEFVSSDYDPEQEDRTLWKWEYNEFYDEEYERTAPHPVSGHCRYLIPAAELIKVAEAHGKVEKKEEVATKEESTINFNEWPVTDGDDPIGTMTIRDKCAIDWKKPVSSKAWLNELIVKTFPDQQ